LGQGYMIIKSFQNLNTECVESGKTKQYTLVSQSVNYQSLIGILIFKSEKGCLNG
jgi:hypothetical protein